MREFPDHYEEEYVYLADLTHDAALISWGKFFFTRKMELVKDKKIHMLAGQHGRHSSIGANCESFGVATVTVRDARGAVAGRAMTSETYAWVTGLKPDTEYTYAISVEDGAGTRRAWAQGKLWEYDRDKKEAFKTDREYHCRFRTFPSPSTSQRVTFAVIGDTGTGRDTQRDVARALEHAVTARGARFVVMVGDTIYAESGGSGDDDFEWLTTYFQPYRTIIDRVPFFPCVGNHDSDENLPLVIGNIVDVFTDVEKQEDRLALYDNLLVTPRFMPPGLPDSRKPSEASISPGLFYRFSCGSDVELICLDTSRERTITNERLFEFAHHKIWLEQAIAVSGSTRKWRIPFCHHPPFCKGPAHSEDETRLRGEIIPLCERHGVQAFFSGHEHNFQFLDSRDDDSGVRCFVTGGAGKFRTNEPRKATDGFFRGWGGNDRGHFLMVDIDGDTMSVEAIDANGDLLAVKDIHGAPVANPIVLARKLVADS